MKRAFIGVLAALALPGVAQAQTAKSERPKARASGYIYLALQEARRVLWRTLSEEYYVEHGTEGVQCFRRRLNAATCAFAYGGDDEEGYPRTYCGLGYVTEHHTRYAISWRFVTCPRT